MAAAGTGWDAAAQRRECTIPPDQLRALNALPGWERTFQAAPLDETPDDSPASSQHGAREHVPRQPEQTRAVAAAASPGAHARRQRAPVLSFDDEDEADEEDEKALLRADALVRAGRGDANPEMADPQTRGLRGVAVADPPRAADADAAPGLGASLLPAMEREGLAIAFSPARTRGRAAAAARAPRASAKNARAEAEPEDIMPTQAADPEAQTDAARGAAAALATLFSPVGTRASRRRAMRVDAGPPGLGRAKHAGGRASAPDLEAIEAIAPTQAEPGPESPPRGGVFSNVIDAVRGAVVRAGGGTHPFVDDGSARSARSDPHAAPVRSPFAGRHRRRRRDDAREDARSDDAFRRLTEAADAAFQRKEATRETMEPSMDPTDAAAVVRAVAAAAADGPTPPPRATSAFGDQGGDAPDGRDGYEYLVSPARAATRRDVDARVLTEDPPRTDLERGVDLASSLVARRFSTGKKRKRERTRPDARGPPAPAASPASRVVSVEEATRTSPPGEASALAAAGARGPRPTATRPAVSPVDALLAARFSGKKKRKKALKPGETKTSPAKTSEKDAEKGAREGEKGVAALVDVDGDGLGAPWYAGGTAEKDPADLNERRARRRGAAERTGASARDRDRMDVSQEKAPRDRDRDPPLSALSEKAFAALRVIADMAGATEARLADAAAERTRSFAEAAAAKTAVARPPSSVARAISFEEARGDAKEPPEDALALFGDFAPRFRGKRRVSASAPRRTPAAGASAPKAKARDPRRSAMSLLGLGD